MSTGPKKAKTWADSEEYESNMTNRQTTAQAEPLGYRAKTVEATYTRRPDLVFPGGYEYSSARATRCRVYRFTSPENIHEQKRVTKNQHLCVLQD